MRLYSIPTHQFSHSPHPRGPLWHHQGLTPLCAATPPDTSRAATSTASDVIARKFIMIITILTHYSAEPPPTTSSSSLTNSLSLPLVLFSPNQRVAAFPPTTPFPSSPLSIELNKKPRFFQYSPKRMQWKRRTASPSYCVWKAFFFFPRVYVGYVCSKNQLRENKTNQTPPLPNLLVPQPITFLSPHMPPSAPIISNPLYQNLLSFSVDA